MKTVWIVDDDREMTRAISLFLKLMDCEATSFFNARSVAQALLSGETPQLLILDVNMPEVSGLDLLEFVRRRDEWRALPVLMLSSEDSDVMIDQALEIGADGYVTKPVTLEELECAMGEASRKRLERFDAHAR